MSLVVVLGLVVLSSDAAGQSTGEALILKAQQTQQPRSSRDTLKNGAIIGAVVGAAALGTLGAFYCHLYQEENGPSCRSDTLRAAAIGAAIGTGTGLVLDASFARQSGVTVRMRVRF